jgi:type VI protein secretion system component Hcp
MADVAILEIPNFPKSGKTFKTDIHSYQEGANPRDGGSSRRVTLTMEHNETVPALYDSLYHDRSIGKLILKFTRTDADGNRSFYLIVEFAPVHIKAIRAYTGSVSSRHTTALDTHELLQIDLTYGRRTETYR